MSAKDSRTYKARRDAHLARLIGQGWRPDQAEAGLVAWALAPFGPLR